MSLALHPTPRRRRLSLTPLIDVVFLLLVFFMLAARFGVEGSIDLSSVGGSAPYSGPPRLVEIAPGTVTLNGRPLSGTELPDALTQLTETPDDAILIQATGGVTLQELMDTLTRLSATGFVNLVLVE